MRMQKAPRVRRNDFFDIIFNCEALKIFKFAHNFWFPLAQDVRRNIWSNVFCAGCSQASQPLINPAQERRLRKERKARKARKARNPFPSLPSLASSTLRWRLVKEQT